MMLLLAGVHFGPTATKAAGKAAATVTAAGAAASGGDEGGGMALALGALGVLIVLGLLGYVALRFVQKKDDDDYKKNKFVPARKWAWELTLNEAEEATLLRGLQAWETNDKSLYLSHEEGTLTLYLTGKQVLVSLFLLAERFKALGPDRQDAASVARLVDELAAREQPGVIGFSEDWFSVGQLDGMDHDAFLSKVRDTLTWGFDNGLEGSNGWYSDENYGRIDLRIIAEPSPEIQRLRDQDKFDEIPAAESKCKNVFLFNVGPLVGRYQRLRAEQPALPPEEAIRSVLVETLAQSSNEFTWSRVEATPTEQALVRASAAGKTSL